MDNKIEVNFRIKIRGIIPDNIEKTVYYFYPCLPPSSRFTINKYFTMSDIKIQSKLFRTVNFHQ